YRAARGCASRSGRCKLPAPARTGQGTTVAPGRRMPAGYLSRGYGGRCAHSRHRPDRAATARPALRAAPVTASPLLDPVVLADSHRCATNGRNAFCLINDLFFYLERFARAPAALAPEVCVAESVLVAQQR